MTFPHLHHSNSSSPGDSTADLLYQHDQEGYHDHPYADYPYAEHSEYGAYPGDEDRFHPGEHPQHPGYHRGMEGDYPGQFGGQFRDQEEEYEYYQQVRE